MACAEAPGVPCGSVATLAGAGPAGVAVLAEAEGVAAGFCGDVCMPAGCGLGVVLWPGSDWAGELPADCGVMPGVELGWGGLDSLTLAGGSVLPGCGFGIPALLGELARGWAVLAGVDGAVPPASMALLPVAAAAPGRGAAAAVAGDCPGVLWALWAVWAAPCPGWFVAPGGVAGAGSLPCGS